MSTEVEIKERRIVPDQEGIKHRGQYASQASTRGGGICAWGFGSTEESADEKARSNLDRVSKMGIYK